MRFLLFAGSILSWMMASNYGSIALPTDSRFEGYYEGLELYVVKTMRDNNSIRYELLIRGSDGVVPWTVTCLDTYAVGEGSLLPGSRRYIRLISDWLFSLNASSKITKIVWNYSSSP